MTVRHLLSGAAIAAASTLLFAGGAKAQGTPLINGGFATPPPILAGLTTNSTFLQSASSAFNATNATQTIMGTLLSSVYRNNLTGNLDFFYQVLSSGGSNSSIGSFSITSFAGTTINVAQTSADIDGAGAFLPGGNPASQVARETTGEGLTFTIAPSITAGGNTYAQFVQTSAKQFTTSGQAAVLGSGVSANLSTNVIAALPPTQAPEPGSLALAATGLMGAMGMVGIRRRRSAK